MNLRAFLYKNLFPLAKIYWRLFRPKSSGAGCLIQNGNKILLIKQTYGKSLWSFPGGGMHRKETPLEAVKREVWEEVGIKLTSPKEIGCFVYKKYREETIHVFHENIVSENFKIDPGEIAEARWFEIEKIDLEEMSFVGKEMFKLFKNISI